MTLRPCLVPYERFRAELRTLAAAGAIESGTAPDGSTVWRLPDPDEARN